MPRRVPSPEQYFEIGKRLEQECRAVADGMCEYTEGFDDDVIANIIGVPKTAVANFRTKKYGRLRAAKSDHAIGARLAAAERMIEELVRFNGNLQRGQDDLKVKYNKLIVQLDVNHGMHDVKHLIVAPPMQPSLPLTNNHQTQPRA